MALSLVVMSGMFHPVVAATSIAGVGDTPDASSQRPLIASAASLTVAAKPPLGLSELNKQINERSEEIVKLLLEVQRLNTEFRLESTRQPKLRQWRQSLYVLANSGCTVGGTADAMAVHYPNIHPPGTVFELDKKVSSTGQVSYAISSHRADPRRVRAALNQGIQEPQVVGNLINAAGDVFELGANARRYFQLKHRQLGPSEFRRRILELHEKVDEAIARRDDLVSQLQPGAALSMAQAEGLVLCDFRDVIMIEYSQYHSSAMKLYWFQNAAYMLDFAKNTTGAVGGIISIEGSHLKRPRWGGSAALFTTISGALVLSIPMAGRVAGNWAATTDRHAFSKDFGAAIALTTDDAIRDYLALKRLTRTAPGNDLATPAMDLGLTAQLPTRLRTYEALCSMMRSHEMNITRYVKQAKSATIENVIYGTTVGTTKVSLGICGMLSGWRYYNRPWIASRLTAAGNTAYCSGSSFSILENTRILATHVISDRKLSSENMLPGQIYHARLDTLAELKDKQLRAEEGDKVEGK